ncbi:hypothetical protein AF72_10365 [Xylella taiwanensis]|uniref:Uncharacterized protein n=1 Tax=Xylella taiwanensis TaxID=1444770 RepID=Z9JIL5_9GAMM|nr:hypothetical protein AF72_10365 [Xylella taiwanensis]
MTELLPINPFYSANTSKIDGKVEKVLDAI